MNKNTAVQIVLPFFMSFLHHIGEVGENLQTSL